MSRFEYTSSCQIRAATYRFILSTRCLFLAIFRKHDVIHKTGSTSRIATLSVDGRTTVIRACTVTSMQVLCVVPYRLQAWLTWPISNVTEKNPNRLNRSISVCGAALVGRELVWTGCRSVRITVWTVPGRGATPAPAMHESHNLLVA